MAAVLASFSASNWERRSALSKYDFFTWSVKSSICLDAFEYSTYLLLSEALITAFLRSRSSLAPCSMAKSFLNISDSPSRESSCTLKYEICCFSSRTSWWRAVCSNACLLHLSALCSRSFRVLSSWRESRLCNLSICCSRSLYLVTCPLICYLRFTSLLTSYGDRF